MSIIPATVEAEVGESKSKAGLGKTSLKNTERKRLREWLKW
jgi:hypothetical protein